jgi:tetratricopeptide (TPR) repeat protein
MNLKKSIVFCVSFIAVFFGEIAFNIACGPMQDPYDYYVSYFHNTIQGDRFTPFAFNGMLFLNSEEDVLDERDVNSAEWARYLKVKQGDVSRLMYDLDSAANVRLEKTAYKWAKTLPDSLKRNSFLIALNKNQSALRYYNLIKKCEPMISIVYDSWNQVGRDSIFLNKSADEAKAFIDKESNQFLKLRYAYQAQRLYFYGANFSKSKAVYENYIANNPTSSAVKGWAMANYAGILRHEGDSAKAAYLYSKVFLSNPERRIVSYRNYFWIKSKIDDVLKFAKKRR